MHSMLHVPLNDLFIFFLFKCFFHYSWYSDTTMQLLAALGHMPPSLCFEIQHKIFCFLKTLFCFLSYKKK